MDNRVIVITSTFPHEAHFIVGYLNSHGIETSLKDEMTVQANTNEWKYKETDLNKRCNAQH